jgi:hypothetical protein
LKKAGLPFSQSITCASAGVSPLTIAQMLGHSSTQIVPRYAQVLDQNRVDAMKKLTELKKSANQEVASATAMKPSRECGTRVIRFKKRFQPDAKYKMTKKD